MTEQKQIKVNMLKDEERKVDNKIEISEAKLENLREAKRTFHRMIQDLETGDSE